MSFVVECNLKKIEVNYVVNGLIIPDDTIVFDAVLINGNTAIIAISRGTKGYQEALSQIREINKKLKEINCNCEKEKEIPTPKPKYKWSEWKEEGMIYVDPFIGIPASIGYSIRTNGKRVEAKFDTVKGSASCNIAKGDKFDYEYGKALAIRRMIANFVAKKANDLESFNKEYEIMNKHDSKK